MNTATQLDLFTSATADDAAWSWDADQLWDTWIAPGIAAWRISAQQRAALHVVEARDLLSRMCAQGNADPDGYLPPYWNISVFRVICKGVC